jgi:hypothetical protein
MVRCTSHGEPGPTFADARSRPIEERNMSMYMYESHDHDRVRMRCSAVNSAVGNPSSATMRAHPAVVAIAVVLLLIVAIDISLVLVGML